MTAVQLAKVMSGPSRFLQVFEVGCTVAQGHSRRLIVLARYARNRRLAVALHQWAFCSLRGSPGARTYYQALRSRGIGHQAALRQLGNRLVGILHGCLKTGNEHGPW